MVLLAAALAAAAAGLYAAYDWAYDRGFDARDTQAKLEALESAEQARRRTGELSEEIDALREQARLEQEIVNHEVQNLRRQLAAGAVRLRVPAAGPGPSADRAPADRVAAGAQPGEAPAGAAAAEPTGPGLTLDPQTSIELLDIAAEGDAAIRDLNECVRAYNIVRDKVHGTD
jgi:prophage endopeptidase